MRLIKLDGIRAEYAALKERAEALDASIKVFKHLAKNQGLVSDDAEFAERVAFDIDPKTGAITWLLLRPGKQHDRNPFGGYGVQTYDAYKID